MARYSLEPFQSDINELKTYERWFESKKKAICISFDFYFDDLDTIDYGCFD